MKGEEVSARKNLSTLIGKINHLRSTNNFQMKLEQLNRYISLLYEYNDRYSLTGVEESEFPLLVAESLLPADEIEGGTLMDVGSGGGIPAIPLRIFKEDTSFTLIEPSPGKYFALKEISHKLGITDISIHPEQLEKHIKRDLRYDYITVRGIAPKYNFFKNIDKTTIKSSKIIYYRESIPENLVKSLENLSYKIYNIHSTEDLRGVTILSKV